MRIIAFVQEPNAPEFKIVTRCEDNEDLIPPPQPGSAQIITFTFTHPDHGTTELMRGLAVTGTLDKNAGSGNLCVSATGRNYGRISSFPYEATYTIQRNACLAFVNTFRKYPYCTYGGPNGALSWLAPRMLDFRKVHFLTLRGGI